ncbi:MAG: hypothetical protein E7582_03760 [Ruminococcaceae bacterium]|nr:hypothetical protein [Oscillospiraceae bacterium]
MSKDFNKKIFSILLDISRGDRSWRQFASDCEISYVQMRKLATCKQENPPRVKLLKKIVDNSTGDIEMEDYLFAIGFQQEDSNKQTLPLSTNLIKQGDAFFEKYLSLSMGQRKMINDFIDFLSGRE